MKYYLILISVLNSWVAQATHYTDIDVHVIAGQAQGTTYQIKYYAQRELINKESIDSVFTVIDNSMSLYKSNSLICQFNSPDVRKLDIDNHMSQVVKASLKYHKLTQGYFDITILPLMKIWGFGRKGTTLEPNQTQIDSVKNLIGAQNLRLKGNTLIKKKKGISIDLNGIAQGYTVDVISVYLDNLGIESYIVEVGGEIFCKGNKPNGKNYIVEIQRPNSNEQAGHKIVIDNKAITTSGSYENFKMVNGQRISHHMNPLTAKPMVNNTLSVTVIANTAMEADALDNYLMYLKPEEAITFVNGLDNVEAYIIYYQNNTLKELESSGFNNYIYNAQ